MFHISEAFQPEADELYFFESMFVITNIKNSTTQKYKILITSALQRKNVRLKAPRGYFRRKSAIYSGSGYIQEKPFT